MVYICAFLGTKLCINVLTRRCYSKLQIDNSCLHAHRTVVTVAGHPQQCDLLEGYTLYSPLYCRVDSRHLRGVSRNPK